MPEVGNAIIEAVRSSGGYTAHNTPNVAVHLVGWDKVIPDRSPGKIALNPQLMKDIELFLKESGIPVEKGLRVLKADAAADALVFKAKGLEGTERAVVIKITHDLGIFEQQKHLTGNALALDESLMAKGVQKTFKSMPIRGNTIPLLVRIEPEMVPVNTIIDALPGDRKLNYERFTKTMHDVVSERGLAGVDLKPNNFGIAKDAAPVATIDELITRTSEMRIIDPGAVKVRSPETLAIMEKPVHYEPKFHEKSLKSIDELFARPEVPVVKSAVQQQPAATAKPSVVEQPQPVTE